MPQKGVTILPEATELKILAHIREDVGDEGDLVDRLSQDAMNIEMEDGEILLSILGNNRVLLVNTERGLASLELPRSRGIGVGFYPIQLLTLFQIDEEFCRRLIRARD